MRERVSTEVNLGKFREMAGMKCANSYPRSDILPLFTGTKTGK
jgi:hypothetical protein